MAKREKAIYAPGELDRVREKLGTINQDEAKHMASVLGGEVGYERTDEQEKARQKPRSLRHERVDVKIGNQPILGQIPKHRIEPPLDGERDQEFRREPRQKVLDPADNPSIPLKVSYWERIKMDRYAGQSEFEIKSSGQVLFSVFSVFGDIPDYVNPVFISKRMREYYQQLEMLVVSTRSMFPRNNMRRNERIKKSTPLVFAILDVIRYWNIERISGDLARLQARPRNIRVGDCADILRAVYKPLFVLDRLDIDTHIRAAYKILYKVLYIENPMDAQNKYQDLIRTALVAFGDIRREIHYLLYPLLMKAVSSKWLPYDRFFMERRNRIMAFLGVTEEDQIDPSKLVVSARNETDEATPVEEDGGGESEAAEEVKEETPEEQAQRLAAEAEKKALDRGIRTLEMLFPNAGWDRISAYPDFYPYFVEIFDLRKGFVNIAPTDPLQQIYILMRIIEELFYGLRYVSFGTVPGPDGNPEGVGEILSNIINEWHYYMELSFQKEYLPRMLEYIRMLEGSSEDANNPYTKKVITDLHWIKRLYFLPYYKFESLAPAPFHKKDITPIYPEIKKLRKYLAIVGAGIEMGNRAGGAREHAPCDGIDNPWDPYAFQVPNPLSVRLDALLAEKNRNNASLVYFSLAVATVLDYLVNNDDSWAYHTKPGSLFRSVDGEGVTPLTGIDTRIDADALFKASLKKRRQ